MPITGLAGFDPLKFYTDIDFKVPDYLNVKPDPNLFGNVSFYPNEAPPNFYTDVDFKVPDYLNVKPDPDLFEGVSFYPNEAPQTTQAPKKQMGFGDYLGAAADLAEGISSAVRAYKGYPDRNQGSFRPSGNRLGQFMRLLQQVEDKTQREDPRLGAYKEAIKSIFQDPDVLSDFIVRAEELKKKKEAEKASGQIVDPTQATPVQ
jgi:hypothetical protein